MLEAVLFGHVKGAFTGGRTLKVVNLKKQTMAPFFLMKLARCLPALEAKFLRVLQEESGEGRQP